MIKKKGTILINMLRLPFSRHILSSLAPCPSTIFKYYSSFLDPWIQRESELRTPTVCDNSNIPTSHPQRINLPTLIPTSHDHWRGFSIELVDPDVWPQTRLAATDRTTEVMESLEEGEMLEVMSSSNMEVGESLDFEEIEDLRLRKKLFYKLCRGSKEFEEHNINFHRKKSLKKGREKKTRAEIKKERKKEEKAVKVDAKKEHKELDNPSKVATQKNRVSTSDGNGKKLTMEGKRVRTPTFNQLTAPYHMPFCLDIFITKGSVRASIIHRVTSRVVAVAHSISKDLKFDLGSRKDAKACVAVGEVLAQRALEDDIHNIVYTPRKGDKIEGKLQIVLQSIIDNGIDVKVKPKQKKPMKKAQMKLDSNK